MLEMDCMDCHNRPSHDYQTPFKFINDAITAGNITKELPEIKMVAMGLLAEEFSTTDSALTYIENEINYYLDNYKPFDKAGAYGIQEWIGHIGITTIEGSYFNVVGLPTHLVYKTLNSMV